MLSKYNTEMLVGMLNRGSMGLIDKKSPNPVALELSDYLSTSWRVSIKGLGSQVDVYADNDCPLVITSDLEREIAAHFPDLVSKKIAVDESYRLKERLALMSVGIVAVDSHGNIATLTCDDREDRDTYGKLGIIADLNSKRCAQDDTYSLMRNDIAIIGVPDGCKNEKILNPDDLDYDVASSHLVRQFYGPNGTFGNQFRAFCVFDSQINHLKVIRIGYFDGLLTRAVCASDDDFKGIIIKISSITKENSTEMLFKVAQHVKGYVPNI